MQDFPASGILANDVLFDEKGAIILIAFLCSHLTNDKRLVSFFHISLLSFLFSMHTIPYLICIGTTTEFDQYEIGLPKPGE